MAQLPVLYMGMTLLVQESLFKKKNKTKQAFDIFRTPLNKKIFILWVSQKEKRRESVKNHFKIIQCFLNLRKDFVSRSQTDFVSRTSNRFM